MLSVVSGAVLLGFQYALLALGVYISFRILNIPDLTVDGSFTFGIAVSAVLCASGHPFLGLMAAVFAGFAAGIVTGFLQTKAKIHPILAGILTMSGLYTVNITVMGAPNVSLIGKKRFYDGFASLFGENSSGDLPKMILAAVICAICVALLIMFFKTVKYRHNHRNRTCNIKRARCTFGCRDSSNTGLCRRKLRQRYDSYRSRLGNNRRSHIRQTLAFSRACFGSRRFRNLQNDSRLCA